MKHIKIINSENNNENTDGCIKDICIGLDFGDSCEELDFCILVDLTKKEEIEK